MTRVKNDLSGWAPAYGGGGFGGCLEVGSAGFEEIVGVVEVLELVWGCDVDERKMLVVTMFDV